MNSIQKYIIILLVILFEMQVSTAVEHKRSDFSSDDQIIAYAIELKKLYDFDKVITNRTYGRIRAELAKKIGRDQVVTTFEHATISRNLVEQVPIIIWQISALLLWCLFLIYIYYKRWWFAFISIFLMCVISSVLWIHVQYNHASGLVAQHAVQLHLGPGEEYPPIGVAGMLDEVQMVAVENNWCNIRTAIYHGWVLCSSIKMIRNTENDI